MDKLWTHCFRLRPHFQIVGLAIAVLCSGLACFAYVVSTRPAPNNANNMAGLIFLFLGFASIGLWLFLSHVRYRLFLNDNELLQVGVILRRRIRFNTVKELKWRCWPQGGSVRIADLMTSDSIELGIFNAENRERLITLLRQSVDESRQQGWAEFAVRMLDRPKTKARSRRAAWFFIALFAAHAIVWLVFWAFGWGVQYLLYSILNAGGVVYLCRSLRNRTDGTSKKKDAAPGFRSVT